MKCLTNTLVAITALLVGYQGAALFSASGKTGQYLGGNLTTVANLSLLGALVIIVGLVGLMMGKNWGKWTAVAGLITSILAGVVMMTTGQTPLLQLLLPVISLVLVFVSKK